MDLGSALMPKGVFGLLDCLQLEDRKCGKHAERQGWARSGRISGLLPGCPLPPHLAARYTVNTARSRKGRPGRGTAAAKAPGRSKSGLGRLARMPAGESVFLPLHRMGKLRLGKVEPPAWQWQTRELV